MRDSFQDISIQFFYFEGETSALDFKPLKIPAVFRLLRPEFREQLKSHSCQVQIPTENGDNNSNSNSSFK